MGQYHHQNYHNNRHDIPPGMLTDQQDYYGIPYTDSPRVLTNRPQQYHQHDNKHPQHHEQQQVSSSGVFATNDRRQPTAHVPTSMVNDGYNNANWQLCDNYSSEIKHEPAPYVITTGPFLCQDQGQRQQVMAPQAAYEYFDNQLYEQTSGNELGSPSPASSYFQADHCQDNVDQLSNYGGRSCLQTADYYENPMTSSSRQQEVVQYIPQQRAINNRELSGDVVTSDLQYNVGFAPESLSPRQLPIEQTDQRYNPSGYVAHQNVFLPREHHHHQQQQQQLQQQQQSQNDQIFRPRDECAYAQYEQKSHAQVNLSDKIANHRKPAGLDNPIGSGAESVMTASGSVQSATKSPQFYYVTHHPHHPLDHQEQQNDAAPSSTSIVSPRILPPVHGKLRNDLNNASYAPQSSSQSASSFVSVPTSTQVASPVLPVSHSNETLPHSWHSASVGVSNTLANSDSDSNFDNFYSDFGMCVKNEQSASPTIAETTTLTATTETTAALLGESNRSQYVMPRFANNRTDTSSHQQKQQQQQQQQLQLQNKQIDKDHISTTSASISANRVLHSRFNTGPQQQQQEYLEMGNNGTVSQDWLDTICRYLIGHMNNFGICVIDNFLGSIRGELILEEVQQLYTKKQHSKGRLVSNKLSGNHGGSGGGGGNPSASSTNEQDQNNDCSSANYNNNRNNDNTPLENSKNTQQQPNGADTFGTIRNDRVIWVDGCEDSCIEINNLIQTFCSVVTNSSRLSLYSNKGLDKVIINKRTKAHVACYPGNGTRYIKHVDNPNNDGRVITAIYYLNKNWDTKLDGGLLRMFPAGMDEVANIEPLFDRALFFWSDRRNPHEVLPAYRDRFAITVWFIGEGRP